MSKFDEKKGGQPLTFNRPMAKEDGMAKVILKIEAQLKRSDMRKLNPHLRQKGLTIRQAIERGFKKRVPAVALNAAAYLAAVEGVGVNLDRSPYVGKRKWTE